MNEKQNTDKSFFSVAVKAPSAAVLDTNSEATVIINRMFLTAETQLYTICISFKHFQFFSEKVKCRNLPYFTAFNVS